MTENVMKLLKRVLDTFVLEMVDNELMQFDFVPGQNTTDHAIFIIKYRRSTFLLGHAKFFF